MSGVDPHSHEGSRHPRCLSLDLEVSVSDAQIRAFAGLRPDTGRSLIFPSAGDSLPNALAKLDYLSDGADFLLGHNLIEFDLPYLRAVNPDLRLLRLPAVDTLRLNPLALGTNKRSDILTSVQLLEPCEQSTTFDSIPHRRF